MTPTIQNPGEARERLLARAPRSENGCRLWEGAVTTGGYGKMWVEGRLWDTHRLSYVLFKGEIPEGLCVCHTCDTPNCVEHSHLWAGTRADNMQDCVTKGRGAFQRHPQSCPRGDAHWARKRAGDMPTRGEKNAWAKLTEQKVRDLRSAHTRGENVAALARALGVTPQAAWSAIHRKTWKHVA
jgi:hypothetical protein